MCTVKKRFPKHVFLEKKKVAENLRIIYMKSKESQ